MTARSLDAKRAIGHYLGMVGADRRDPAARGGGEVVPKVLFAVAALALVVVIAAAGRPALAAAPTAAWTGFVPVPVNQLQPLSFPDPTQTADLAAKNYTAVTDLSILNESNGSLQDNNCVHTETPNANDPHHFYHPVQIFKFAGGTQDSLKITWKGAAQMRPPTGCMQIRSARRSSTGTARIGSPLQTDTFHRIHLHLQTSPPSPLRLSNRRHDQRPIRISRVETSTWRWSAVQAWASTNYSRVT